MKIGNDIYYVGVNDHQIDLFEGQYVVPNGMSYNSYVIMDEKIAVMDTVDANFKDEWLENVARVLDGAKPDYLVVQHMEPDHAANIENFMKAYPDTTVVANTKTFTMMGNFFRNLNLDGKKLVVANGDSLTLGKHVLTFVFAPMVHWPEVMVEYEKSEKILFSADGFGKFGALDADEDWTCEARRYYFNIVGKYGAPVQKALSKLSGVPLEMICSTHGPVWKENIAKVIGIYDKLSRYEAEEGVVIAYGSMYGHTAQMAEEIAKELATNGIKNIAMHDVSVSDKSYILRDIFRYKALIIGSPTYNTLLFPDVELLVSALRNREIKSRIFGCFGSYSWACRSVKELTAFGEQMHWDMPGCPVEMKQGGNDESMQQCRELAKAIAAKLQMA